MNESKQCARCGAPVPAGGGVQGMCPRCLMELAALPPEPSTGDPGPAPSVDELAKVFPRLTLVRLIGKGGMGAVYEARQPELDRRIALKVLPLSLARDPAFAERFEREARTLARLDHSNIVRVHDAGRAGDWFYLALEYVDGVDLRQLLRAGECTPRQALAIVAQLCDALQYAHDQGVVHRDIKPENVLVDRRGHVKVADFGLAKLLGRAEGSFQLTRSDQAMGTLHYMAPEQVERPLIVDHRADIYSLGVVLYELLTGELPIGRFPKPSEKAGVDARLDEVVLKTLEKEPARRYQQASEVKTAVGLAHRPVSSAPVAEELEEPRSGRSRRNRGKHAQGQGHGTGWAVGCGCLVLLVLLGFFFLLVPGVTLHHAARERKLAEAVAQEQAVAARVAETPVLPLLVELREPDGRPFVTAAACEQLELREPERTEAEAALVSAREAYLALESEHALIERRPDGQVRVTLQAFAPERAELLAALERDLAACLGPERGATLFLAVSRSGPGAVAPYGESPCELGIVGGGSRHRVWELFHTPNGDQRVEHVFEGPLAVRFRRFLP